MVKVTYSLREYNEAASHSTAFYAMADAVTDQVLQQAEVVGLGDIARQRSDGVTEDFVFELLLLGVLWNSYQNNAAVFPQQLSRVYHSLFWLRKRYSLVKPFIDKVRGWMNVILLRHADVETQEFSLKALEKLLVWLEATCEYREETKLLRRWQYCISQQMNAEGKLALIAAFAAWFERESAEKLGSFTQQVDLFLAGAAKNYRLREDAVFCGRKRVEYHLNMVGATIMNRTFRPRFQKAAQKVVLLPLCMSARQNGGCQAKQESRGLVCGRCTNRCRIYQITQLGEREGFEVLLVPHSSGFTRWLEQWRDQEQCGIVAVACVLNLLAGGYEMKSLRIPAQCVFLDYCGCQKHWRQCGISTDIDEGRLLQIVRNQSDGSIAV